MYKRAQYQTIIKRLKEPRHFLQVVLGPRQVGKTTVVKQVLKDLGLPFQLYSCLLYTSTGGKKRIETNIGIGKI